MPATCHAFDALLDATAVQPLVVACDTLQEALTRADQARRQVALAQAELAHYEAQALALRLPTSAGAQAAQRPVNQR